MADGTEKLPRGIRNKNPGNIKLGTAWDGLASDQTDPTFCIFNEAVMGIRALMKILLTYRFTHKRTSVDDIISRWAPPSENDTSAYIDFVCKEINVNPMDKLDNSIEHYLPLVKSIIRMENGKQPYDDELLVEGMYKAWEGYPTGSSASQSIGVQKCTYMRGTKNTVNENIFLFEVIEQDSFIT